jgi:hypothetical protein
LTIGFAAYGDLLGTLGDRAAGAEAGVYDFLTSTFGVMGCFVTAPFTATDWRWVAMGPGSCRFA